MGPCPSKYEVCSCRGWVRCSWLLGNFAPSCACIVCTFAGPPRLMESALCFHLGVTGLCCRSLLLQRDVTSTPASAQADTRGASMCKAVGMVSQANDAANLLVLWKNMTQHELLWCSGLSRRSYAELAGILAGEESRTKRHSSSPACCQHVEHELFPRQGSKTCSRCCKLS